MSDKLKPLEIKKLLNFYESLLIEEEDIQSIMYRAGQASVIDYIKSIAEEEI